MEDILLLILSGEPLDVILHEHAFKALLSQEPRYKTGASYAVKLPANLSGMDVSYIRFRSKTLWKKGANFSSFQIPSRTLPMPFVKRLAVMYEDLGNLSSRFYNNIIPGYFLVSSVVGFGVYDASNLTTTIGRKIDLNTSGAPISVHFPDMKLPRGAKCATFGGLNGEFSLSDMSVGHVCYTRNYGRFSVVIPKRKRKKGGMRDWWGVGGGFMTTLFVSLVGVMVVKMMRVKRVDEMELQMEGEIETVWVGDTDAMCNTHKDSSKSSKSRSNYLRRYCFCNLFFRIIITFHKFRFHPSSNPTAALQEGAAPPPSAASSAAPSLLAAAASAVYSLLRRSVLLAAVSSADPSSSSSSHLRRVLTSSVFSFNISDFFEIEMIMMLALL
ncbi:hypothetical protein SSX86_029640 [Deinandra increscens subsp. villosa]|uniref:Uncharacterized protein n=1 Tax=Deinandra increscens subsp. villosa TaxID=3103831 RepID=A0AAP0GMK4_9ASTR